MKRFIAKMFIAIAALALAGCGATTNPFISKENTSTVYRSGQQLTRVQYATVVQVRDIQIAQSPVLGQRVGATVGTVSGYAIGRQLSKKPAAQAILAGLGGAIGSQIGKQATETAQGQEIVVEMENKRVYVVAQASTDGVRFRSGDKVMVIGNGRIAPVQ